jgi:hypothetical protein
LRAFSPRAAVSGAAAPGATLDLPDALGAGEAPPPEAASAAVPAPSTTAAADVASTSFFNMMISCRKLLKVNTVDGAGSRFVFGQRIVRVVFGLSQSTQRAKLGSAV